ncbi:hypothetical protein LIER_43173 [Lithospermum erythrorhizon]|uniref:Uncharacterized protein n=1 Tax=Lithospermum erythrorhizon TaxID=34254 RepID=A0AAV3PR17_LITER
MLRSFTIFAIRFEHSDSNISIVGCSLRQKEGGSHMNISNFSSFEELIAREQEGFRGLGIDDLLGNDSDISLNENQMQNQRGRQTQDS